MKKNKTLIKYYSYRIRLFQQGRKKNIFFKIVVVNSKNRIIANLGYIVPHANSKSKIKPIGLNRNRCIFWLLKHAVPSYFVFFIFENVGLIKYDRNNLK